MKKAILNMMLTVIGLIMAIPVLAQNDDETVERAKKLANPIANLISVPVQYNYDEYSGLNDGAYVSRLNIQRVIPFSFRTRIE